MSRYEEAKKDIDYEDEYDDTGYCQWDHDEVEGTWMPVKKMNLKKKLGVGGNKGYYMPFTDQYGRLFLSEIDVNLDGLIQFKKGPIAEVFKQVEDFWSAAEKFKEINKKIKVLYKQAFMLHGPAGCGKSTVIAMLMKDTFKRGGIGLKFSGSGITLRAIEYIREIQPNMKIMVVFEDVDQIMSHGEEELLNLLDGVETQLDNTLFLGTTNHFDRISPRLLRPSRFNPHIELGFPVAALRKKYLESLVSAFGKKSPWTMDQALKDTEGFSFADMKEFFLATCVFEKDYSKTLASLKASIVDPNVRALNEMNVMEDFSAAMRNMMNSSTKAYPTPPEYIGKLKR